MANVVGEIDAQRQQGNLSSAIRLFVLKYYRSHIPDRPRRGGDPG
jgi:predicted DNA-binding ribbon-helix-helix protein